MARKLFKTSDELEYNKFCDASGSDKNCLNHTFAGYNYMDFYARHFEQLKKYMALRGEKMKILEIGVLGGNSLRLWESIFPGAEIWGIDNDPQLEAHCGVLGPNTHVERLSQRNTQGLINLNDDHGPFNLVIDDGSHAYEDIINTMTVFLPRMAEGGLYVVEDVNVGWPMPDWSGMKGTNYGPNSIGELLSYLNNLMLCINMRQGPIISVNFYHGLLVMEKATNSWAPGDV